MRQKSHVCFVLLSFPNTLRSFLFLRLPLNANEVVFGTVKIRGVSGLSPVVTRPLGAQRPSHDRDHDHTGFSPTSFSRLHPSFLPTPSCLSCLPYAKELSEGNPLLMISTAGKLLCLFAAHMLYTGLTGYVLSSILELT